MREVPSRVEPVCSASGTDLERMCGLSRVIGDCYGFTNPTYSTEQQAIHGSWFFRNLRALTQDLLGRTLTAAEWTDYTKDFTAMNADLQRGTSAAREVEFTSLGSNACDSDQQKLQALASLLCASCCWLHGEDEGQRQKIRQQTYERQLAEFAPLLLGRRWTSAEWDEAIQW